jgi:hypothetical protein
MHTVKSEDGGDMTARIFRRRPSPAMVVSLLALFVALGGTGYAALKLPANSVGAKQLKKNAVTGAKVKDFSLFTTDFAPGQLPRGAQGAPGLAGPPGPPGPAGQNGQNGQNGTVPAVEALKKPPTTSGWSGFDTGRAPTYYKDLSGGVRLAGALTGGVWALDTGTGNVAFTLPAGYRPGHTHYQSILVASVANNGFQPIPGPYVGIGTDGAVHMIADPSTTKFFASLDGITFRAEH